MREFHISANSSREFAEYLTRTSLVYLVAQIRLYLKKTVANSVQNVRISYFCKFVRICLVPHSYLVAQIRTSEKGHCEIRFKTGNFFIFSFCEFVRISKTQPSTYVCCGEMKRCCAAERRLASQIPPVMQSHTSHGSTDLFSLFVFTVNIERVLSGSITFVKRYACDRANALWAKPAFRAGIDFYSATHKRPALCVCWLKQPNSFANSVRELICLLKQANSLRTMGKQTN
jgi:hypothetical protein